MGFSTKVSDNLMTLPILPLTYAKNHKIAKDINLDFLFFQVAKSALKNKPTMNYEELSRCLRDYYDKNIIHKTAVEEVRKYQ